MTEQARFYELDLGAELAERFAAWASSEGTLARVTKDECADLAKAFIAGALSERGQITALAREKQATYWVGPGGSLVPRRPFAVLLTSGELPQEPQ